MRPTHCLVPIARARQTRQSGDPLPDVEEVSVQPVSRQLGVAEFDRIHDVAVNLRRSGKVTSGGRSRRSGLEIVPEAAEDPVERAVAEALVQQFVELLVLVEEGLT